jgi:hypothetical protein
MRGFAPLLIAAALGSCTTTPEPSQPSPQAQQDLAKLLAGKTAGPKISCLPNYNANDMQIIDGRNVAFKLGSRTVYLMHLSPGCEQLASGHYALLAKQFGGMGYCQGDIVHVFDSVSHFTAGSCGIDAIVPYGAPGTRY